MAALGVLWTHGTQFYPGLPWGFVNSAFFGCSGVTLFFVLSGFLMADRYRTWGEAETVGPFLRARMRRTLVPYYAVLPFALLSLWLGYKTGAATSGEDIARAIVLMDQHGSPVLWPAWTLSVEWAFYLLYACTALLLGRWVVLLAIGLWALGWWHAWATLWWSADMGAFVVGMGAAGLLPRCPVWRGAGVMLAAVGALVVAVGLWLAYVEGTDTLNHHAIRWALPYGAIVLLAAWYDRDAAPAWSAAPLLVGDASYALYLTHYLLRDPAAVLTAPLPVALGYPLALAFMVAGGVLAWRYGERPLLARFHVPRRLA